eukprot:4369406-Ditylum_brightwellii.AAC.1
MFVVVRRPATKPGWGYLTCSMLVSWLDTPIQFSWILLVRSGLRQIYARGRGPLYIQQDS